MSAAVIALPTAAAERVPVWRRRNQNWPSGVVVLADARRARHAPKRQAEHQASNSAEAVAAGILSTQAAMCLLMARYVAADPHRQMQVRRAIAAVLDLPDTDSRPAL